MSAMATDLEGTDRSGEPACFNHCRVGSQGAAVWPPHSRIVAPSKFTSGLEVGA